MARVLPKFDWDAVDSSKQNSLYPWEQWCNGRDYEIKRGEDFSIGVYSMRQQLWNKARALDMNLNVAVIDGETLVFKFSPGPRDTTVKPRRAATKVVTAPKQRTRARKG